MIISGPLRDVFDAFDPLGMLLRVSIHWGCFLGSLCSFPMEGISIIFGCIFEFFFAFLAVDTAFFTPYDSSPRSPMMPKL